ncbi:PREDICTED: putative F-box protein At3g17620 [Camelina sativa]|uniref:F-box protein At3g17620 n=1 Tax=Camelina sativa TaxID=90675 RepID=A0ABM0T1E3_CAMSA|nr:PREDICTED: putative F-box protein At3g17620 [Camelina sativa]
MRGLQINALAQEATSSEREFLVVMIKDFRLYLMSVNLHGIQNQVIIKSSIKHKGQLTNLHNDSYDRVGITGVCHCSGLLLCTRDDYTSLVVWNPYTEQSRRIELISRDGLSFPWYAIGYETRNSCRKYKVLRYNKYGGYEIYELDSNTWRVLDVKPTIWETWFHHNGISVKGNSYWHIYRGEEFNRKAREFLFCFDFTRERFGPLMPFPFQSNEDCIVTLSTVREEQLAVLCQHWAWARLRMKIWITNKIAPNEVSWDKLFLEVAVDLYPRAERELDIKNGYFLVDEKKKVAVVFDNSKGKEHAAFIFGENGCYGTVDLGKTVDKLYWSPFVCSYIPSSVQI